MGLVEGVGGFGRGEVGVRGLGGCWVVLVVGAGDNGVVGGRVSDGGGVGEVVSRVAGDFSLHFLR